MAKLGKKARKFARKHLQTAAKRNRKIRNQFNNRRPRRGGGGREDGRPDDGVPQRPEDANTDITDATLDGLEFPDDEADIDTELSDTDDYLPEDPECPYYSDNEDGEDKDRDVQDGLDKQNAEMNLDIRKQKKKLKKLLDKDPEFANFLDKWKSELESSRRNKVNESDEDMMDSMDDDGDSGDRNPPNAKILTSKTISEWCQLVAKDPKSPVLRNLLNAFQDACQFDNIFRALLEVSDDLNKGKIMNLRDSKKWQAVDPLIKSYLRNSVDLLNQFTDNKMLTLVLTRLRASPALFCAYPSTSTRLLKILVRLWESGDQSLSLCSFLLIREVCFLLPDCLDICLTGAYNAYLARTKLVNNRNTKHIDFLMNCLVELYSLDVKKSFEKVVMSVGQLNAILRLASKTKEKEDLWKIDNWQYINCLNLWVRFLCCNYKDYNLHPLLLQLLQVVRGVAHLFPGTRYLPLRLKLVQMLNELSTCSHIFIPVPSLLFDCLEFRVVSQNEQAQKTMVNFSSLLKVPKSLLKSRDFQEECTLTAIRVLSAHFVKWSYHVSFPEVATIPLILLKRLHEQTTLESLRHPIKRLIDQVTENKDFIQRKREVVTFSPNDKTSIESFLQDEKNKGNASFTRYYAFMSEERQPRGRKAH